MSFSALFSLPWRRVACACALLAGAWHPGAAGAEDAAPLAQQLHDMASAHARQLPVAAGGHAPPVRVEVEVGALDERIRLAPCLRMTPYLPPGTRPWGRIRVGVRCVEGDKRWNVFLPVTVRVYGRALMASSALAAGLALRPDVLRLAEVDLAEAGSPALVEVDVAAGRTLVRPLAAGQTLREHHLRPRQWFGAGDMVKLIVQGRGFAISSEGRALTPGLDGQIVRVRVDGGRTVSGVARGARAVEVQL